MKILQQRWFGFAVFLIVAGEMVCLYLAYARQFDAPELSDRLGFAGRDFAS